jgi:hypothetical protein
MARSDLTGFNRSIIEHRL